MLLRDVTVSPESSHPTLQKKPFMSLESVRAFFAENAPDITVIEYLKQIPSKAELKRLYDRAGLSAREGLRAREPLARDLDLVEGAVSDDAILDAMVENPILIERPLVETEKGVRLCRPQDKVREIL